MSNRPLRVQRKRTKGFRLPENTVCVNRPSPFGNPFTVEEEAEEIRISFAAKKKHISAAEVDKLAHSSAVRKFRQMMNDPQSLHVLPEIRQKFIWMRQNLHQLTDKNLACYCSLDVECHRDVLIVMANPESNP